MTRRDRRPPGGRRGAPAASPPRPYIGRRGRRRLVLLALVVAAALVALLVYRPWTGRDPNAARDAPGDAALLDSLKAADARRDWVAAVYWAERLARRHPRDPALLLARGTAWSNYAVAQRPARALARPALRTSLERIACQRRAFALTDSAATAARDDAMWLRAMRSLAEMEETLGLPGDALLAYELIKQRLPDEGLPALRAYWLRAVLYDPVDPDTSAWDAYQRSLGRR